MQKIRVLVADSRELLRIGVAKVLESTPNIEVVSICSSGEEAVRRTAKLRPDIVLLDANIIAGGCVEVARRIKELLPEVRIIVLTLLSQYQYHDSLSVLNADVSGYADLDVDASRLVDHIVRVYEGGYIVSPVIAQQIVENLTRSDERAKLVQETSLSQREAEVLRLVAQGMTNKEIADTLFISESTAKAHLHSILKKMKARSRQHAALLAREKGIFLDSSN